MRIGVIVPGFSADEGDWCIPALRTLVAELARHDDVRVVTLRYPHQRRRYRLFGAEVLALGGATVRGAGSAWLWQATLRELAALHRRAPFDVLHAFWASETGAVAAIAGRLLRIPVIVSIAGGELVALPQIGYGGQLVSSERLKIRLALRLATRITAGSAYACQMATPFLTPGAVCQQLPLGIDQTLFAPGTIALETPPRLVQAASLVPVKDQATLLRALALLRTRRVTCSAELAGAGPLEAPLRELASQLGLASIVRFCGELAHDQLPAFYSGAALFVLSSLHEAQCMAALEAAACGVPLIGSAVGVLPELAPDAATCVTPGDPAALADAIEALLRDAPRRLAMAHAAHQGSAAYGSERCVAQLRQVYDAVR